MATQQSISTYRDVFKNAWLITKNNRWLWIFGFFAAFLGVGGEFESVFRNYSGLAETTRDVFNLQMLYQGGVIWAIFSNIQSYFSAFPWQSTLFIIMFATLALVFIWLAIISQIALFNSAYKLSKKRKTTYNEGYHVGTKHFASVFLINLIFKIVVFGLLIAIAAPLFTWFLVKNSALGGVLFIILIFLFFIPVSVILSFIVKYAVAFIVIKGKKASEAVRLGWELFKQNWLVTLEMALIILAIGLGVGLVILLAIGIAAIPFILVSMAALMFGSTSAFTITSVLGVLVWFLIAAVIGAAYVSYQYTAWTLLFVKLVDKKAQSKLKRWFGGLSASKGKS